MMLGKLFCQTNYYKKHYRRAEFLGGCLVGSPIHTAVFGSTQIMYAVDFSKIPSFSGVNFALPVQPLKYDAMILGKALKNMPPAGNVIFGICPFSFLLADFSPRQKETELFSRYHLMFSPQELPEELTNTPPVAKHTFEWKHFFRLFNRKEPRALRHLAAPEEYSANAGRRMKQWQQAFMVPPEYSVLLAPEAIEINCNVLRSMISLAHSRQQNVYILLPPVSKELYSALSLPVLEKYLFSPLKKATSGSRAKLLDFTADPRFSRQELFLDSLLLDDKGQQLLSQLIADELKKHQKQTIQDA